MLDARCKFVSNLLYFWEKDAATTVVAGFPPRGFKGNNRRHHVCHDSMSADKKRRRLVIFPERVTKIEQLDNISFLLASHCLLRRL